MVADGATSIRAAAIEAFACALRELRESAGNPSFRELAGRSSAISHTTLHEAAQGNRLPSWPTTVEFVKACGADPADYRDRWQQADDTVRAGCGTAPVNETGPPVAAPVVEASIVDAPAVEGPLVEAPGRRRRRYALVGIAALVVAAAATVGSLVAFGGNDDAPAASKTDTLLNPAQCPVHQTNPPTEPPAHAGDAGVFVYDVTLADCTHVNPGQTMQKVWRFKNVGTVTWSGYVLHRMDEPQRRNQCQTITDVPVARTAPGHTVDVRTDVTAPTEAGLCFVRFKMEDAAGRIVFPASRPVYFQIIVR